MFYSIVIALVAALTWALPAAALEADQVRGELVDVMPDEDRLRLRVEESGDERQASEGQTVEYRLDPDTRIEMEDPMRSVATPVQATIDDLEPGQEVVLQFEDVNGQMMARNVRSSSGSESADRSQAGTDSGALAQRDDTGQRSRLPDTASILPLLALTGAGFGLAALGLRVARRR